MNKIYIYDGGFISFIALVVELFKNKITPDDIKLINSYDLGLFDTEIYLKVENEQENIKLLKNKISREALYCIYNVFLSDNKNKEIIIYNFLKSYFKYGKTVFGRRNIDCVNESIQISKYVRGEAHKLKGFLRFSKMKNNFYYAKFESNNNVIGILASHFSKRLMSDNWIIHDTKRGIYAIYDKEKVIYLTDEEVISLNLEKDNEDLIEDLWKTFYKTIGIKERENKRCRQNFMPKKYWKNMLEVEDEL
ncbi:MAG: TIGR03915 family putative DNA repair protein [Bacilli bacterium]|nr:TIGR03915 family putative DNA repair protein [Bacilli bacterium]